MRNIATYGYVIAIYKTLLQAKELLLTVARSMK